MIDCFFHAQIRMPETHTHLISLSRSIDINYQKNHEKIFKKKLPLSVCIVAQLSRQKSKIFIMN